MTKYFEKSLRKEIVQLKKKVNDYEHKFDMIERACDRMIDASSKAGGIFENDIEKIYKQIPR